MPPKKDLKKDTSITQIDPNDPDTLKGPITPKTSINPSGPKPDDVEQTVVQVNSSHLSDIVEQSVNRVVGRMMDSIQNSIRKEINDAIQTAVESVFADFKKLIDDRVLPIENKVRELELTVSEMGDRVSQNYDLVGSVSSDLLKIDCQSILEEMKSIRAQSDKSLLMANENEQYSRRNNLRFRGLAIPHGANTTDAVLRFLGDKLGLKDVQPSDIMAAHPVPAKFSMKGGQTPPLLVKFRNRQVKDSVIRKMTILKGTFISIDEDLTALNSQLISRLRKSERVTKVWSWNGRVFATLDNESTIIAKPLLSMDELFKLPPIPPRK